MLASITPLGERSRQSRWGVTVSWFFVGALAGGVLTGALLGGVGALGPLGLIDSSARALTIGGLALLAGAVDLAPRLRLPTTTRQVNAYWLGRFRGWVVGVGFGFQLGTGVATIVTTATVYATLLVALASGSAAAGALIGAAFGLARSVAVLPAGRVQRPSDLMQLSRWVTEHGRVAARATGCVAVSIGLTIIGISI